jgi:hypothetical protein
MSNKSRRNKQRYLQASPFGGPASGSGGKGSGTGWGVPAKGAKPASGSTPVQNPFMQPKPAGLTTFSQTFPSNYYVEWNLATWRSACDQAIKNGYTMSYATMVSWAFESSPFIQSLFEAFATAIGKIPFMFEDYKGNELPEWTEELCNKFWQKELRKEIALSKFWGFTGVNFDPASGKIYKYPMQDIDPINQMLKQSTFSFFDGEYFAANDNLLFIQPSQSYESFLGWMQPITRSFIQMNLTKNNWVAAGRKLAFPVMTLGYPQNGSSSDFVGPDGLAYNQYKIQAEAIAANIDPSKALVYPYTIGPDGTIQKSIEVDFESSGTPAKAHAIFSDFNSQEKDEIREMVLGGTLTSSTPSGGGGTRAQGSIHEGKLEVVIENMIEFVETYINGEYLLKIKKFYKNFPAGRFVANKTKQLTLEDITALSTVLNQNGKRFTDAFFEANGLATDFFEDAPVAAMPGSSEPSNDDDTLKAYPATRENLAAKKKA